ncbi:MAG: hypothetical protein JWL72_4436 [Ilumatobacteraceae bacterium]|nr:hypothetical protein [Ilumatobacteraceae bacterium]MCU1391098.1 hypothetical protein [Ilumatobacteraceae bacterium]
MELMKSQRQFIAEVITGADLDPLEFEWFSTNDGDALQMSGTEFEFAFSGNAGFVLAWSPGTDRIREGYGTLHSISEVAPHLRSWLEAIKRELGAVDPWAVRREMVALLGSEDDLPPDDESPFSPTEQASWREALGQMQHDIDRRLVELGAESTHFHEYVARQFDVLRELLPTRGKRAWRTLLRDFLVNIAATATWQFGPSGGQAVVHLVQRGLPLIGLG